jgi:predicted transcriptional regulator
MDQNETITVTYTRKKKVSTKQPVAFKIDKDLLEKLNSYAAATDRKKIDIVEEALREYFQTRSEVE